MDINAPGWRVERLGAVGSTNDVARERARDGDPGRLLIIAEEQLSGRGRRGRQWHSPPGNLYCSALLRPPMPPQQAGLFSFVTAVALAAAIAECAPEASPLLTCKWPNDLRIGGAKVSGILLESGARPDGGLDHLIIGTGINVRFVPDGATERYPATCLADYGQDDPDAVAAAYLRHLADWCARFAADGFAPVRSAWLDRAEGLGAAITVRLGREELQGRFRDFGHDGALMLERPDGTVRPVVSGEIVQTVPAG
mgnify:CR=1 FL=1